MFSSGQQNDLNPQDETENTTPEEGQPQGEQNGVGDSSQQYVTKAQYEQLLREIRRVQSSSDKGLNSIRQEMSNQMNSAMQSYKMATGQDPTPEQVAQMRSRIQENVLMGQQGQQAQAPTPQAGQPPTQPQQPNAQDAWFEAANAIASQVEGGLTDKDPEMRMVNQNAPTPQEWLASIGKAVAAKQARITRQQTRQPGATSMVSGNGTPANGYDPTMSSLSILENAHRPKR